MAALDLEERASCGHIRAGFTLVELAVLVQIGVLMIAILAPSLRAARDRSKQSICLDRLRGIGAASRIYQAGDPSGWGIPVHPKQYNQCPSHPDDGTCDHPIYVGAYEWGGKSGIGQDNYWTGRAGDPLNSKYGTRAGFGPTTRPINRILYPSGFKEALRYGRFDYRDAERDTRLELDAYVCPADDGPPGGAHCADWVNNPHRSSFDHFGNSYAANTFMVGNVVQGADIMSNSPYLRPTSRVPNPARTIAYEENIGRWAWAAIREACDGTQNGLDLSPGVSPGPTKTLRGWHGKNWTYNRTFVDAHAERQPVYIEGTENAEGYAFHYRIEIVFPDDSAMQQRLSCIIVRGDGWQKDTLPADPIPTRLIQVRSGRPSYEGCVRNGFQQQNTVPKEPPTEANSPAIHTAR